MAKKGSGSFYCRSHGVSIRTVPECLRHSMGLTQTGRLLCWGGRLFLHFPMVPSPHSLVPSLIASGCREGSGVFQSGRGTSGCSTFPPPPPDLPAIPV